MVSRRTPHPRLIHPAHALIVLSVTLLAACSGGGGGSDEPDTGLDDGQALDIAADVTVTADVPKPVVVDPYECPGGHLCPCAEDTDCDSELCTTIAGDDVCAEPCDPGTCVPGQRCLVVDGLSGSGGRRCLEGDGPLCNPCNASSECSAGVGFAASRCVDYGQSGSFCGLSCTGELGCPDGYTCAPVDTVEGTKAMQCVVEQGADDAGPYGECSCSPAAIAQGLSTACQLTADVGAGAPASCPGTRTCRADGLSLCEGVTPSADTCNGLDDDCDGATDELPCDDGEDCTDDSCDGTAGCLFAPRTGGCDLDGTTCTPDVCDGGVCLPVAASSCDDDNPCTADTCKHNVGCLHAPIPGIPCDADGNACTVGDTCKAGACQQGAAKDCADNDACTLDACDPATGACTNTLTAGLACDDDNACTTTDLCDAVGECLGTVLKCNDGDPCTSDLCDPASGCNFVPEVDGASCDDGNGCTENDTCQSGTCVSGAAKSCPAGGACTVGSCDIKTGACAVEEAPPGTACNDGDACTDADVCAAGSVCAGSLKSCDDGNVCTTNGCDSATGCTTANAPGGTPCDDGTACTEADACALGACVGNPVDCNDDNACTADTCDPQAGCDNAPVVDGTGCNDGSACTDNDDCTAGVCGGDPIDCDDGNECTLNGCDVALGCTVTNVADNTGCNDDNACTQGDVCLAGACTGTTVDCDDANVCTNEACDPAQGCTVTNAPDGTGCTDGDQCTDGDACSAGQCVAGANVCNCQETADCAVLEDGDLCNGTLVCNLAVGGICELDENTVVTCDNSGDTACKVNLCDAQTGQCSDAFINQGGACNADDDACTPNDTCDAGQCVADAPISCTEDDNPCTTPECDPADGACKPTNLPASVTCDGDACNLGGTCADGSCANTTPVECDDNNPCTTDSCDAVDGCMNVTVTDGAICDDGDACTDADQCTAGVCAGSPVQGTVSLFSGSGAPGFGDNADPTLVVFQQPSQLEQMATGEILVADTQNHRIRVLDQNGGATTLTGLLSGYADGDAFSGFLKQPGDMAVDASGAVWIADTGNHAIRKYTALDGLVTVAGYGPDENFGVPLSGFANGTGGDARFNNPRGIALALDGNLYIVDTTNNRVRKLNPDTLEVTTLAGSGANNSFDGVGTGAGFASPFGIDLDPTTGDLIVAEFSGQRIRRVQLDGTVTTVAGDGTPGYQNGNPINARFLFPWGVEVAADGDIFVADSSNNVIRRIDAVTGLVSLYVGDPIVNGYKDGSYSEALFNTNVQGVLFDSVTGVGYVVDTSSNRIRKLVDPNYTCGDL